MKAGRHDGIWQAERNFISHMVQMKGKVDDERLEIHRPLYPTWFRWKI